MASSPQRPDLSFEAAALLQGYHLICGVDEAGRGPWAGPVVAAAVILNHHAIPAGLNDSKKLTQAMRERLYPLILATAQVGVGIASVQRIDRDNILQATLWAMGKAVARLKQQPDFALVDGNRPPLLPCPVRTIIEGDGRSLSIAAASIIAKTVRDRMMIKINQRYPGYSFDRHKGYGTKAHAEALSRLGICPQHRLSFAPIRVLAARSPGR